MSWFTRKKQNAPELIEPTISLFESPVRDSAGQLAQGTVPLAADMSDITDIAEVRDVSEPAVQSSAIEDGVEVVSAQPSGPDALVSDTSENINLDKAPEAIQQAADEASAPVVKSGKFSSFASRFKRDKQEKAASTAPVAELPTDVAAEHTAIESDSAVAEEAAEDVKPAKAKKAKSAKPRKEKHKFAAAPIRVVIGFLPEVTERDALEYAVGIAEKHFEQIGMSFFDAFKYGNGYAFEAHEGGTGRAYLPEIIKYFNAQGAFRPGENVSAVIRTATRAVEVQRTRDGLIAVILPERDESPSSDWLEPTSSMQPAINKRTGFLVVGATLFTTGFIAMIITSMLTRFQEYESAPDPVPQRIYKEVLPINEWDKLQAVPAGSFVKALRYRNGAWEKELVNTASVGPTAAPTPGVPPTTVAGPAPASGANSVTSGPAPTPAMPTTPPTPPVGSSAALSGAPHSAQVAPPTPGVAPTVTQGVKR